MIVVIVDVPTLTDVTTPVPLTVATPVLLLDQVTPGVVSVSAEVEPSHIERPPVIAAGWVATVTIWVT